MEVGPQVEGTPSDSRALRVRGENVEAGWTLGGHLSRTFLIAAGIAGFGVWLTLGEDPRVWVAAPVFWLVANVFEWATHKFPMHRPLQPRLLYKKHAIVHHNAFAGAAQEIHDVRELSVVMMPWYTLLIIFGGASPIAVAAGLVGGPALAGVFLVSAVLYFLLYELIHTLHHLPRATLSRSWVGRWRVVGWLRAHHHHHHQLDRMAKVNFNVTFPFADWLLRTYEQPR